MRSLLNGASGLNDGLALPVVLILVGALGGMPLGESTEHGPRLGEVGLGLLLGVVASLTGVALALVSLPGVGSEPRLAPLGPHAAMVLHHAACEVAGANLYLDDLRGRHRLATVGPTGRGQLRRDELVSERARTSPSWPSGPWSPGRSWVRGLGAGGAGAAARLAA